MEALKTFFVIKYDGCHCLGLHQQCLSLQLSTSFLISVYLSSGCICIFEKTQYFDTYLDYVIYGVVDCMNIMYI